MPCIESAGDADWAFVTTRSPEALTPIPADYDQRLQRDTGSSGGWSHLLRVFLIDEGRFVRNMYSSSFLDPVLLGNDIATLALHGDQDAAAVRQVTRPLPASGLAP